MDRISLTKQPTATDANNRFQKLFPYHSPLFNQVTQHACCMCKCCMCDLCGKHKAPGQHQLVEQYGSKEAEHPHCCEHVNTSLRV